MRLLLPLTLGVLVVYIFVIPFNFFQPSKTVTCSSSTTPCCSRSWGFWSGDADQTWSNSLTLGSALRSGIIAVSILATLVSLYALSAIIYRTVTGAITINRLTMIGWNVINIALFGADPHPPVDEQCTALERSVLKRLSLGAVFYVSWSLFVILGGWRLYSVEFDFNNFPVSTVQAILPHPLTSGDYPCSARSTHCGPCAAA